jgi:hypothetical protein
MSSGKELIIQKKYEELVPLILKYRRIRELNLAVTAYLKQNSSVWMGLIGSELQKMGTTEDEPNLTFDVKTLKQIKTSNGIS